MIENEVREAIYQRFKTAWADRTDYWFDNETAKPEDAPWVRLSVRFEDANLESFGGGEGQRTVEVDGTVYLQYFEKPGGGTADFDAHMKIFIDNFGFKKIPGTTIRFLGAIGKEIGNVDKGRWWSGQGRCGFMFDKRQ